MRRPIHVAVTALCWAVDSKLPRIHVKSKVLIASAGKQPEAIKKAATHQTKSVDYSIQGLSVGHRGFSGDDQSTTFCTIDLPAINN